jgi:diaminopimelate epimerase
LIPFVKAHACGNDFLVVDARSVADVDKREAAIRLCDRHTGVGADGVEYFEWTGQGSGRIRLFNADGSIAEISGNGTRCVAAWMALEKSGVAGETFDIETDAGLRTCRMVSVGWPKVEVSTGMGMPRVGLRFVALSDGSVIEGVVVSTGNPHFVVFVKDESFAIGGVAWEAIGREICFHPEFPQQTNVEFVRVVATEEIEIRIFERGVGPTTSSGTGTCASAAAAIAVKGMPVELLVTSPGGAQRVSWAGGAAEMTLTGPAELIATGEAF